MRGLWRPGRASTAPVGVRDVRHPARPSDALLAARRRPGGDVSPERARDELKFDAEGLIPAVVQDRLTGEVRMVAYMNRESISRTLESGRATFYSRSRR